MKTLLLSTATAMILTLPVHAATLTDTYSGYLAFGDSLSDDGKLSLPAPYFEGQFSSGPVWTEIIGGQFDAAGLEYENFALGGATAGDANRNDNGILSASDGEYPDALKPFATFNSQIDTFIANFNGITNLGDNPLISVLFGANDIFQQGGRAAAAAANSVADGIERLAALGDQYNDFAVYNLPSVAALPNVGQFNDVLAERLTAIEMTGTNIIQLDYNAFQTALFPRLSSLGVIELEQPCLTMTGDCTIIGFNADGTPIRDLSIADTFYLIDSVHPSAVPQREFASFAISALEAELVAPIPLPASLTLLLAGLGGLGAVRLNRRRKSA